MKFLVTIQTIVTTEIEIRAESASKARELIEEYGIGEAAMDMATSDVKSERIKSIRKSEAQS